jgi:hydroxymethylpyrimidine pyrophosphatase-like HAD family hydrolase
MTNDVLVFRKKDFSIATANASDEVKAHASMLTGGNDNKGFAKRVRKFVLRSAAA